MELLKTSLLGCYEIRPKMVTDGRGHFVKPFQKSLFEKLNLVTEFREDYYSVSRRGVVRGMHFQSPPHDHEKVVYCVEGDVFDVIVDLRGDSPTFKQAIHINLTSQLANAVYIPRGCAHGFCAISETATMMYKVSSEHAPMHDHGIHWASIPVQWPSCASIVSSRDAQFVSLNDFVSPF